MTWEQVATAANAIGVIGIGVSVMWLFYKGKIRLGSDFDKLEKDRNQWKDLALRGLSTADRATTVAAAMAGRNRRPAVPDDYVDQDAALVDG